MALLAASAAPADAKPPLLRGFSEDLFLDADASVRTHWFGESRRAGAGIITLGVSWADAVGSTPPAEPTNPADPAYRWGRLDSAISEAKSRGLQVMLIVHKAPSWAEGPGRPSWAAAGSWKPDPAAFGAFAQAIGRRYSGQYADASGVLPRVDYFEAWNEPNYIGFLSPQWEGGSNYAPAHYRALLNAFYDGIGATHPSAKIVAPGTLPAGNPEDGRSMRPLEFMRDLLCLDRQLNPRGCGPAKLDVLSHHPISAAYGPSVPTKNRDDITVSGMKRLIRVLRAAERAGTVSPPGRRPVWATEIWWFTERPRNFNFEFSNPPSKQARWLQEAFYLLWRQGVQAVIWYQIADDTGFPSGLFSRSGRKKPAYTAFSFPFVGDRRSNRRIAIWGIAPASGKVSIERKRGSGWQRIKKVPATKGRPFTGKLKLRGSAKLRARVGGEKSLVWKQR